MLSYIRWHEGKLVLADSMDQCQIVRAVSPTAEEVSLLSGRLNVPTDFLTAATDRDERPRVEIEDSCRLIIVRIPHREASSDTPYTTLALAVILTPSHIVTVCSEASTMWADLVTARNRIPSPDKQMFFLCSVFLHIARQYLTFLRHIRDESDTVEDAIHGSMKNEMMIRMLNLEKCLVYFTTSLRANEPIWDRFRRINGGEQLTEQEQELADDVRVEFRQAQELANIYSNILSGMMDAFASIISNNLNVVMKFLTSITIILMLPTLVASLYGMNVELPFQHSPHAFLITLGVSLVLAIVGVGIFLKKKWF
jgi:magnesium transporter